MLGRQDRIFHSGIARNLNLLVNMEMVRIVDGGGSLSVGLLLGERTDGEMEEHSVAESYPRVRLPEPQPLRALFFRARRDSGALNRQEAVRSWLKNFRQLSKTPLT